MDNAVIANRQGLEIAMRAAAAARSEILPPGNRRVGGLRSLAALLGISPAAISGWKKGVPLARVAQVEEKTGVPRHLLRPDHWTAPPTVGGTSKRLLNKATQ